MIQSESFRRVWQVATTSYPHWEIANERSWSATKAGAAHRRSVFDLCSEQAHKTAQADFVPAMKAMRIEAVDEEWERRLNSTLI